jgi:hypothetical protein
MTTVINNITVRQASTVDIPDLVTLNQKWFKANLDNYEHGFLSVAYDEEFFEIIINNDDLLVFEKDNKLEGYVLVNTVIQTQHIDNIRTEYFTIKPDAATKNIAFSCQVLIDKPLQGTGFIYHAQKEYMNYFKRKYHLLVSTLSKENIHSFEAHKRGGWTFIDTKKEYYLAELEL